MPAKLNPRVKAALDNERIEKNLRAAKPRTCRRCGADTLRGEDDDKICMTATVDPEPIDLVGEMWARLDDLFTYDLVEMRFAGISHLYRRSYYQVARGDQQYPILRDHTCRQRTPEGHLW